LTTSPTLELKTISPAHSARGAVLALRRAAIADDPATTRALNVAGRRQARKAASLPRGARAGDFAFKS
jgi:hypothetical protein